MGPELGRSSRYRPREKSSTQSLHGYIPESPVGISERDFILIALFDIKLILSTCEIHNGVVDGSPGHIGNTMNVPEAFAMDRSYWLQASLVFALAEGSVLLSDTHSRRGKGRARWSYDASPATLKTLKTHHFPLFLRVPSLLCGDCCPTIRNEAGAQLSFLARWYQLGVSWEKFKATEPR